MFTFFVCSQVAAGALEIQPAVGRRFVSTRVSERQRRRSKRDLDEGRPAYRTAAAILATRTHADLLDRLLAT